jgi:hypothetical protein
MDEQPQRPSSLDKGDLIDQRVQIFPSIPNPVTVQEMKSLYASSKATKSLQTSSLAPDQVLQPATKKLPNSSEQEVETSPRKESLTRPAQTLLADIGPALGSTSQQIDVFSKNLAASSGLYRTRQQELATVEMEIAVACKAKSSTIAKRGLPIKTSEPDKSDLDGGFLMPANEHVLQDPHLSFAPYEESLDNILSRIKKSKFSNTQSRRHSSVAARIARWIFICAIIGTACYTSYLYKEKFLTSDFVQKATSLDIVGTFSDLNIVGLIKMPDIVKILLSLEEQSPNEKKPVSLGQASARVPSEETSQEQSRENINPQSDVIIQTTASGTNEPQIQLAPQEQKADMNSTDKILGRTSSYEILAPKPEAQETGQSQLVIPIQTNEAVTSPENDEPSVATKSDKTGQTAVLLRSSNALLTQALPASISIPIKQSATAAQYLFKGPIPLPPERLHNQ